MKAKHTTQHCCVQHDKLVVTHEKRDGKGSVSLAIYTCIYHMISRTCMCSHFHVKNMYTCKWLARLAESGQTGGHVHL